MLEAKLDLEREFETIIGLEVHVELKTGSKLFCGCKTSFGDPPNTNTCPVCLALPGALPVLNREAVRYAVKAALALECRVARVSKFDRKNYFYPDLPKAYQISQYDLPLGSHGQVRIRVPDGQGGVRVKSVRIRRLHLEEDAGKLNHLGGDHLADAEESLVDLNRAGIPLIEIVSEPDLASPEEARLYLQELRAILRLLDISDLRMAEGSMRVDANVSLKPRDWSGSLEDLPRTEIKNVNSLRFVQRALEYEVERQRDLLLRGERVIRETRGFDEATGTTYSQRSKEEAHDYRYFPEPDLPPLVLEESWVEGIRAEIPALPDALRAELTAAGLGPKEAEALVTDPPALAYWRSLVAA
ncbi:MAG: Asp-tRNA(Asn)/Glu-tRNA(Gln) amidotransferase subunit GatB, partial [Firmicutes bacterium]|nr:Asp-tRNA(Asn)/Glu-tRNA(Gln) amidotransferase subunit GatB [Bacillota bacterium]